MAKEYSWRVELPASTKAPLGSSMPKPTAQLYEGNSPEPRLLALAVAKALLQAKQEGWQAFSQAELTKKLAEIEAQVAWDRLLALLNHRDLTRLEAKERLGREGFGEVASQTAVMRALSLRFIDDERYAETYARSKAAQGWSTRRIAHELSRRGIEEIDAKSLEKLLGGPNEELQRAKMLLSRKRIPKKRAYESLVRFLTGKGFDYSCAKAAVSERLSPGAPEEDEGC